MGSPLSAYATVRTEGALLPADILARIAAGDNSFEGLNPASYHLDASEKIGEATNRAWNRMQARWAAFQAERTKLGPADTGTTITRDRWLLPLFEELKFGRLQTAARVEIGEKSYPISHAWHHVPIHLVGCQVDLDKRVLVAGAPRSSPHSLVQELLNRSAGHLWGIVSNGLRLRLLRDNVSLTRQAYVEFDLEAMMAGEAYPDFVLLWLILHQSRFEGDRPELCQLEKWSQTARTEGVRVLEGLREGVQKAIEHLGQGFLAHPSNRALREALRSGVLDKQDYYRQLLRLVYRLLFLFVAEDRDLLVVPDADPAAQKRYRDHYATTRLRRLATIRAGSRHHDLYCSLKLVMDTLSGEGCPDLALPALGSFLFSSRTLPDLNACDIANQHLLEAIRSLAVTHTGQSRRVVDYKNLGAEELGSVYESLLELHPDLNAEIATFELRVAGGSERKTTGSYYTPTSLISCLLDSSLNPALDDASKQALPEAAILALKVVDPACGSGHFLIAAAHRIAKRLAAVRTGEEEPPPDVQRKALRNVIGHCIYGVDVNPMAVELCKVSLWMEALEPGKPLSFLEHRIQCGNSLVGATPSLLANGIPEEAFTPIEGDDKAICREFKRINRDERNNQMRLFAATTEPWQQLGNFAASLMNLDNVSDESIAAIREKERMYEQAIRAGDYLDGRFWADTWCAAFVWKKTREFSYPITEEVFRRIERNPHGCEPWMRQEIQRLAEEYRFFHWHLAFPDVFKLLPPTASAIDRGPGWVGGFSVVLGNPPWVRYQTTTSVRKFLTSFGSYRSTADLSVFFLERSVQITRSLGRVALLTPNKWFGAGYGDALRTWLREHCVVELIVDFGHSRNLFPDADTFPAAVVVSPTRERAADPLLLKFVRAHDADRAEYGLPDLVAERYLMLPHSNLRPDRWCLEDTEVTELLDRLKNTGLPLSRFVGRAPAMGINSGLNDAYYIDDARRSALINEEPACESLIRPFLRGRDIRRWTLEWSHTWHIVIPSSLDHGWPWAHAATESEAEAIFQATFPALHSHLTEYREMLQTRTARGKYWWELRSCEYYTDYEHPKILVQGIAYYSQFALDQDGCYINNMVAFIPSDDLYLLAILNSRLVWWLINHTFQPRKDGGRSLDIQHLSALPVPSVDASLRSEIADAVSSLIKDQNVATAAQEIHLNTLVQRAYGLTEKEIALLGRSLPPRDPISVVASTSEEAATVPESELGIFPVLLPIPALNMVANHAWATPPGIQPDNLVLLAVSEVLHRSALPADPQKIWTAVHFLRKPAMALAFLDNSEAREWVRLIGATAIPTPTNVVDISVFRNRGASDVEWGKGISYLKGVGALMESAGSWSISHKVPSPSQDEWLAGRTELAVRLADKIVDESKAELQMTEFLRSVQDGTARRAVS